MSRAFTLIEVLVSIALISALLTAMFAFVDQTNIDRARFAAWSDARTGASLFLDRLESSLLCSIAGGGRLGQGIHGTSEHLVIRHRGVNVAGKSPRLEDLAGTEVSFESATVSIRIREWSGRDAAADAPWEAIATGIQRLRFRFFNGRAWLDEFDSVTSGRLPAAIEVSVWMVRDGDAGTSSGNVESADEPPPDRQRIMVVADGGDR